MTCRVQSIQAQLTDNLNKIYTCETAEEAVAMINECLPKGFVPVTLAELEQVLESHSDGVELNDEQMLSFAGGKGGRGTRSIYKVPGGPTPWYNPDAIGSFARTGEFGCA
jgi:hypothetical protein